MTNARTSPPWAHPLVRRHRVPLTVLAVAMLVLGGAWAHAATSQVERQATTHLEDRWVERAAFTYEVPLERDSVLGRAGARLPMGEPGYFSTVAPNVDLTFTWALQSPAASELVAHGEIAIDVKSHSPSGRPYWTERIVLAEGQAAGPAGTPLVLRAVLPVEELQQRVNDLAGTVGSKAGTVQWNVVGLVRFSAQTPFGRVTGPSEFVLPLTLDLPLYILPDATGGTFVREHGRPVVTIAEHRAGWTALASVPLAVLAMAGGAIALALCVRSRRGDPLLGSGREGELARELAPHEDWVTTVASAPEPPPQASVIEVESLGDLVAIAAEARTRVLRDGSRDVFWVLAGAGLYRYGRHARVGPPREVESIPQSPETAGSSAARSGPSSAAPGDLVRLLDAAAMHSIFATRQDDAPEAQAPAPPAATGAAPPQDPIESLFPGLSFDDAKPPRK